MENPWKNTKNESSEYIAACDKSDEKLYQKICKKYDLSYIPQPYMGDPEKSEIFLLLANPNAGGNHKDFQKKHRELVITNLKHEIDDYPLYGINDKFKGYFIYEWWYKRLSPIIDEIGDPKKVSKSIFAAEYVPYFSDKYVYNVKTSSLGYTVNLIKKAVSLKKIIIIMRSKRNWERSIPELEHYENTFVLHSPQNVIVSPKNLGEDAFEKVIKRIKRIK